MGEPQAADLMSFCASEFHQFFGHLGNSIHTFKTTGKVPHSVFRATNHAAAAIKAEKPKTKRRPTAFNMFVKQKMEELKQAGVTLDGDKNNNGMFTLAVAEWKKMTEEGKAAYTAKFKVCSLHCSNLDLHDCCLSIGASPVRNVKSSSTRCTCLGVTAQSFIAACFRCTAAWVLLKSNKLTLLFEAVCCPVTFLLVSLT